MLDNPRGFSTEADLTANRVCIESLWQKRVQGCFIGVGQVEIAYAYVVAEQSVKRPIVIAPGRTEFFEKYLEVVFDLHQQGYSVYLLDHRGQGASGRLLSDAHKGHVDNFDDYVLDLQQFMTEILLPREALAPLLLGHSMGGAIVARHVQMYPGVAAAAALCSPMLEINTGAPQAIIRPLIAGIEALFAVLAKEPGYVPGAAGYLELPFMKDGKLNNLTSSEARMSYFNQQYLDQPSWQLGGPTRKWLLSAFEAMDSILSDVAAIKVPLTVLVSGGDRIVREEGARRFLKAVEACGRVSVGSLTLQGAQHELLMESDVYRVPALNHLLNFFESVDT